MTVTARVARMLVALLMFQNEMPSSRSYVAPVSAAWRRHLELPSNAATMRPYPRLCPLRASDDDARQAGNDDEVVAGTERASFIMLDRPFSISDMLMMRTIQSQRWHYMEMRNEPKSNWLANFADHGHLDRGMLWHSVLGLRLSMEEYLTQMVLADDVTITVKYGIGVGWKDTPVPLSPDEAGGASDEVEEDPQQQQQQQQQSTGKKEKKKSAKKEQKKEKKATTTKAKKKADKEEEKEKEASPGSTKKKTQWLDAFHGASDSSSAKSSDGDDDDDDADATPSYGIGASWKDNHAEEEDDDGSSSDDPIPKELKQWATAAAARRKNPYLQDGGGLGQGQRSYDDVIEPRMVATQLLSL